MALTGLVSAVAVLFLVFGAGPSGASDRVALVIGNAKYEHISGLNNPENDAEDMSDALTALGFEVFGSTNASRTDMLLQIADFADAARTADVALFYFAGHAFQFAGQNHLLPTDSNPVEPGDITSQTVRLSAILDALQATNGVRLVFLDACRDNPLGISDYAQADGLASVRSAADYVIAYATQPGAGAFDGEGRNGKFTEAVLNHIHTPGQTLADMMIEVRKDVVAATGGQQVPWESSSLTRHFQFDPSPATVSEETMFYQLAARAADPSLMSLYLERYPQGAHIEEAVAFLDTPDDIEDVVGFLPSPNSRQSQEDTLWQLALQTRSRELAEKYLNLHPSGEHEEAAVRLVAALPRREELSPEELCREYATHPQDATAAVSGVEFERLSINVETTIDVCRDAVARNPEQPHFVALLARATIAAGQLDEAIKLYQDAADRGDLRA
ncbi:MAG: caspase family protein, partial [Pseudomonadota bacterium]